MRVLLVDDHAVVRAGVRRLLEAVSGISLAEATSGVEALQLLARQPIDVVILDLNLEGIGGLELLRRILSDNPKARVIIFSMHAEAMFAARALKAGAKGYVSKGAGADELATAVKRVAEGGRYVERDIAEQLVFSQASGEEDPLRQLSPREFEILRLLGEGKNMSEIAEALGVAYKTVANTCSTMKTKLGMTRTADLIRLSLEARNR